MKIEKEARYYFSDNKLNDIIKLLLEHYKYSHSCYEITTMYDNPNPKFTFYSKEIDGRLRLRYSKKTDVPEFGRISGKTTDDSRCIVTWKRRIPSGRLGAIRQEEEIEYDVAVDEFESVKSIFENVLKCKRVSSYERIRSFLFNKETQVTLDQFPYGIMIEFELRESSDEQILFNEIEKLGLDHDNSSNLSCDDMYFKLCNEQGVNQLNDIGFKDSTMPKIK